MSENSCHASSHKTRSSDHENSSSADGSIAGDEQASHTAQPQPSPRDLTIRNAEPKDAPIPQPSPRKRPRRVGSLGDSFRGSLHAYKDVLNEDIEHASGRSRPEFEALPPSQIDASLWTSAEKDAFFRKLAVCETGNLRALITAVSTKSQPECQTYLRLLREGALHLGEKPSAENSGIFTEVPVALEVSSELEAACDDAARQLSRRVEKQDEEMEKAKHGTLWLIDDNSASSIEQILKNAGDPSATEQDYEHEGGNGAEVVHHEREVKETSDIDHSSPGPGVADLPPSARLLKPAAFVRLSECLFMNGPVGTDSNWRDIVSQSEGPTTPSIYRSAFEDFYNLTVSLTRRLVQASIFQALSRLRAADASRPDWQPDPDVREIDVRTVLDVFNMSTEDITYWSTVARRCNIEVYSDSKKYKEGRAGTKNGVKLTYEEVESELGMLKPATANGSDNTFHTQDDRNAVDSEDLSLDSDAFTLESYTASSSPGGNNDSDGSDEEESRASDERRRRRASSQSYDRAEDQFLEALDTKTILAAEAHLRDVLGLSPRSSGEAVVNSALPPLKKQKVVQGDSDWRAALQYEAEWERFPGGVTVGEFQAVGVKGANRKRKRAEMEKDESKRRQEDAGQVD